MGPFPVGGKAADVAATLARVPVTPGRPFNESLDHDARQGLHRHELVRRRTERVHAEGGSRPKSSISVVICAYTEKRWPEIVEAIASVRRQSLAPSDVVLVIDHCPGLFARATSAFADVTVIENRGPQGLSGARNSGFAAVTSDVVAFLDDDATAAPDWLEHLAPLFDDPSVVAAGGHVEPWWESQRPGWFPPEFDWVVGCSHAGMPTSTSAVRNMVGANMAFRREALADLGGFSPMLGRTGANTAGCEETELCIRAAAWRGGSALLYEPRAKVDHHVPDARGTWGYLFRRCYHEGISKARVVQLGGHERGLSAERTYLTRTVPLAFVRSLGGALLCKPVAAQRAFALLAGTAVTVVGFLRGTLLVRRESRLLTDASEVASPK